MKKNKKKLKCGIIGLGAMGEIHLRAYLNLGKVKNIVVAEKDEKRRKEIFDKYNICCYKDYLEMLGKEDLDAVSICTPTKSHFEIGKYCINTRLHVLIEKPLTDCSKSAQLLLDLARQKNVILLVGHIERFNPGVKRAKEIIKTGTLGEINSIIARRVGGFPVRMKGVDVIHDLAIHDVDIINYLLEQLPDKVVINRSASLGNKKSDATEIFMKYNKASAYVQANWITPIKIRKLYITGTKAYMELDYINQAICLFRSDYKNFKDNPEGYHEYLKRFSLPQKEEIKIKKQEPIKEELQYFLSAVINGKKVDSQFAVDALNIVLNNDYCI